MSKLQIGIVSLVFGAALWGAVQAAKGGGLYLEDREGNQRKIILTCANITFNLDIVNDWGSAVQEAALSCGTQDSPNCSSYYMAWEYLSGMKRVWNSLAADLGCAEA